MRTRFGFAISKSNQEENQLRDIEPRLIFRRWFATTPYPIKLCKWGDNKEETVFHEVDRPSWGRFQFTHCVLGSYNYSTSNTLWSTNVQNRTIERIRKWRKWEREVNTLKKRTRCRRKDKSSTRLLSTQHKWRGNPPRMIEFCAYSWEWRGREVFIDILIHRRCSYANQRCVHLPCLHGYLGGRQCNRGAIAHLRYIRHRSK